MAVNEEAIYRYWSELSDEIIRKAWLPTILDVAFEPKGRWIINRLKRTSKGVNGMKVHIPFKKEDPIAWRAVTEHGYTPSGANSKYAQQYFELGCAVAACNATVHEIKACSMNNSMIKDIANEKARTLVETFPYFLRAVLWSPQGADKAVAVVASVGGTGNCTITIDNDGLWNTNTLDRCKLIERGMVLQGYNGTTNAKKGAPVQVQDVDKDAGTFIIYGDATGTAETTFADGDYFVPADPGGLDVPAMSNVPGFLDVLDDDNTFQGVNRAAAGNRWARAYVKDGSSSYFDYDLLSKFIRKCYGPKEIVANIETVQKYASHHFADKVRYTPAETFQEDYTRVRIDNCWMYADDDVDHDKILCIDFDNVTIRQSGGIQPLHPSMSGWRWVSGRMYMEYILGYWFTLAAEDVRKCGYLKVNPANFAS